MVRITGFSSSMKSSFKHYFVFLNVHMVFFRVIYQIWLITPEKLRVIKELGVINAELVTTSLTKSDNYEN
jgi:hypothetical protein